MPQPRHTICLAIVLAVCAFAAPAFAQGDDAPTLQFKPLYENVGAFPLLSGGHDEGAVMPTDEDFVNEPPAMRMDCSKVSRRVISLGHYIHPDDFAAWQGKRVAFRGMVRWLSGRGKMRLQMRASGEELEGNIATAKVIDPPTGEWTPFELLATIPPMTEVEHINFMVWLENSPEPATVLVDETRIVALDGEPTPDVMGEALSDFAAYSGGESDRPLQIINTGRRVAVIVIEENASETVRCAVEELNEHLKLSTGVELPIGEGRTPEEGAPEIHIGRTALTERLGLAPEYLSKDHWVIARVGDALVLSGGDNEHNIHPLRGKHQSYGTLYAVYEFIERVVGVRWYWPGELGRIVPEKTDIEVGDVVWRGEPSYAFRGVFYGRPKEFTGRQITTWWRRMRRGGVGGSPIGMHSFNDWPERFGDEHPDWFALQRNGQRATDDPRGYVCFSNPEVFEQTVKDVRAQLDEGPERRYVTVMPGDGSFECMCEECQAQADMDVPERGKWSNYVWGFVNRVAAEVRKSHPDRVVTCCAYSDYRLPPTDVHLLPNVAVTICTNYYPYVWRSGVKREYIDEIDPWSEKVDSIYLWDYWLARRHGGVRGAPSTCPHALKEWFALEGDRVKGRIIELENIYADGTVSNDWANWMYDVLDTYVAMQLMWDMDHDVDAILDEYFGQLYGPAAPQVRKFYAELEQAWSRPRADDTWDWSVAWQQMYPPEFVERTMGYLREAEELTRGQDPWHERTAKTLEAFLPFEANSARYTGAAAAGVQNEEVTVPATEQAPTIDGRLDDAAWESAAVAEGFVDRFNSPDLRAGTQIMLSRDADALYVGMRAEMPGDTLKETIPTDSRDRRVWEDESCEVFLVGDGHLHQFLLGPRNIFGDAHNPDIEQEFDLAMFEWDCQGAEWATARGEGEWTGELAIPLKSLAMGPPSTDAPWLVNFCRNYYYRVPDERDWQWETSAWRPPFGHFHTIDRYGEMRFGG